MSVPILVDRAYEGAEHRVLGNASDILPPDLHEVDRQRLEFDERGQAVTEVFQGDTAARFPHPRDEAHRVGKVAERRRFGDLEAESLASGLERTLRAFRTGDRR